MHLVLTGATGLVGAAVLDSMLAQQSITHISILSRRPVAMAEGHDKVKVIIHKDFKEYNKGLLDELRDAHGCVWALGVSQNDVDKEKYVEITHDYPLEAAKAFSTLHPDSPFTFVYVSGEGATQSPGMFTPLFGRVKGQIESALLQLHKDNPQFKPYNIRPAAVDWRDHHGIHDFVPKQPYTKNILFSALNAVSKGWMTPTQPMGKIMTELAMSSGDPIQNSDVEMEGRLISNIAFRRMANI